MKTVESSKPDSHAEGAVDVNAHVMADLEDFLKPGRMAREWYHPRMKKYLLFEEPPAEEMAVGFAEFGADMLFCEQHAAACKEFREMLKNGVQITKDDMKLVKRYSSASSNYIPKMIAMLSSTPKLTPETAMNLLRGLTEREGSELLFIIETMMISMEELQKLKNSSASSAESSTPTPA